MVDYSAVNSEQGTDLFQSNTHNYLNEAQLNMVLKKGLKNQYYFLVHLNA